MGEKGQHRCGGSVADDVGLSECVREEEMVEVKQELAAVKAEMERIVDQLHSQLHYWQNVTCQHTQGPLLLH